MHEESEEVGAAAFCVTEPTASVLTALIVVIASPMLTRTSSPSGSRPGGGADNQLKREQLAQRIYGSLCELIQKELGSAASAFDQRLAHRGEANKGGDLDVVEADHRQL